MAKGSRFRQTPMTTPMAMLASAAIGALMFLIVFMFVPFVGGSVEAAMPGPVETCQYGAAPAPVTYHNCDGTGNITMHSGWNSTYNTSLPGTASVWTTLAGFLVIAAIFAVMGLVFFFLKGMIF
jgi:hypothetical protein